MASDGRRQLLLGGSRHSGRLYEDLRPERGDHPPVIVSLVPTQSDILGAFRKSFLQKVLPQGEAMFSGSISGTTLTVSKLSVGAVSPLDVIFGQGVLPGTKVLAQLT